MAQEEECLLCKQTPWIQTLVTHTHTHKLKEKGRNNEYINSFDDKINDLWVVSIYVKNSSCMKLWSFSHSVSMAAPLTFYRQQIS
jgi:hypothetical protein